ncbi:MAG: mycofactocin system GMC family oxidoreductase MftG [Gordonia sp. (in: high G+C Gram-positive bacteria)]|uniref:mycofactocin system GMC family oxidoreductase MftG n=1 Tax=Gordonia sp. (in: high G+C Gram-positive bacteria) TaxID=84139 RepID=UPI0039E63385
MTVDVLIVGAGSAGCVLAERLSRNEGRRVTVVEAGPRPDDQARRLDRLELGSPGKSSPYARWYDDKPPVVRGRAVGGSSVVNGGYFLRAHHDDFDDWGGPFETVTISEAYDELDGWGNGGTMTVDSLHEPPPVVRAAEGAWKRTAPRPWPGIGVQRVPVNHRGGRRWTAADAYLDPARGRSNLEVRDESPVAGVLVERGRVVGVRLASGEELRAGEVIVCAGTLGTAALLLSSGIVDGPLPVYEHREILVRYRTRRRTPAAEAPVLLPSVVHTAGGAEIRLYADDFARFIDGAHRTSPAVGVAEMRPSQAGELRLDADRLDVRLAPIGPVDDAVAKVVDVLSSDRMADHVVARSVHVEPVIGTSQHAWGSLAMGRRTDWLGAVDGVPGLRVVDGSILPNVSSGPHATIMMMAIVIADALD